MDEKKYLEEYDISKYEQPSVATDMVVFTVCDVMSVNPKKSVPKKLRMMLIKRGVHPYKDKWALPGGFLKMNETLEECAYRELKEETGLEKIFLKQFRTYSEVERDPRGRIISCAYISLINAREEIPLSASSDASLADWFDVSIRATEDGFSVDISKNEERLISFETEVKNDTATIKSQDGELAFDHAQIIADAIYFIRSGFNTSEFIFSLLPEKFTIPNMQAVYSLVMGAEPNKDVVLRLYNKKITKTMQTEQHGQHKRAVLYIKK